MIPRHFSSCTPTVEAEEVTCSCKELMKAYEEENPYQTSQSNSNNYNSLESGYTTLSTNMAYSSKSQEADYSLQA